MIKCRDISNIISICINSLFNSGEAVKSTYTYLSNLPSERMDRIVDEYVEFLVNYVKNHLNSDKPYTDMIIELSNLSGEKFLRKLTSIDVLMILWSFDTCVCMGVDTNMHLELINEMFQRKHSLLIPRLSSFFTRTIALMGDEVLNRYDPFVLTVFIQSMITMHLREISTVLRLLLDNSPDVKARNLSSLLQSISNILFLELNSSKIAMTCREIDIEECEKHYV